MERRLHHVQYTHECRECEEVRVRLEQHALDLVDLTRTTLLRGVLEPDRERGEHLELEIRQGLECYLQRQNGRCGVNFRILRRELGLELVRSRDSTGYMQRTCQKSFGNMTG